MAIIPEKVMLEIRTRTFEVLDDEEYMACGRIEARRIMNNLVAHPDIGDRIAEYVGRPHVRTYIKDAILNRYTKEKSKPPTDWCSHVSCLYNEEVEEIGSTRHVKLFRTETGRLVVATSGRLLKWETGLRKILEYRAKHQAALSCESQDIGFCLILMSGGALQTESDNTTLKRALGLIGVRVAIL